ncbi:MAG: translocation/assembly module TamB domain-containing protein [Bacteroidota bacterium]
MNERQKDLTIKKLLKILAITLLVIIILQVISLFLLRYSPIQTLAVKWVTSIAEENLQASISISRVDYKFFNEVVLEDFYLSDQNSDTLIYAKKVTGYIKSYDRTNRKLVFETAVLDSGKVHLFKDTASVINIDFLVKALKPKDLNRKRLHIQIQGVELSNSQFIYQTNRPATARSKIDFTHMVCDSLNIKASGFSTYKGDVQMQIEHLSFKEKSGFHLLNMKSHFFLSHGQLNFGDITLRTPHSYIVADSIVLDGDDFSQYKDFEQNIQLQGAFQSSNIGFSDISYFAKALDRIKENIVFEGDIYGTVANLKAKNLILGFGQQSEVIVDFSFNGLPNIEETFMYIDVQKLVTYQEDLQVINRFTKSKNPINFPKQLNNLGPIEYKGNFTGFLENFVTYGNFTTDLGQVSTDLALQPGEDQNLALSGELKTVNFDLGNFFSEKVNIGALTMHVELQGTTSKYGGLNLTTKGLIDSLDILNYTYQNINLDGNLTESQYDGYLDILDPNIALNFRGQIDFSGQIPLFNFEASVPRANLYGLNIDKQDTTSYLSFNLRSNFAANSLDNAEGNITVTDLALRKKNEWLRQDTLQLISMPAIDTRVVKFTSDLINARLRGKYTTRSLGQSLRHLYHYYLPSQATVLTDSIMPEGINQFNLRVDLLNTQQLTYFFLPELALTDSSTIELLYDDTKRQLILSAQANKIRYGTHQAEGVSLKTFSNDSLFTALTKLKQLTISNGLFHFDNFELSNVFHNDTLAVNLQWHNEDTLHNAGQLNTKAALSRNPDNKKQRAHIHLFPSHIYLNDTLWQFHPADVFIDSSSIDLSQFVFKHNEQVLGAHGTISHHPSDSLDLYFSNINLANLQALFSNENLKLKGTINGQARLSNLYNRPVFTSNLQIDSLELNGSLLGTTELKSTWQNTTETIRILGYTQKEQSKALQLEGWYKPSNGQLEGDVSLNRFPLTHIGYFMRSFASDVTGRASGSVNFSGNLNNPVMMGEVNIDQAAMTIDYLQTRYRFSHPVQFNTHTLHFAQLQATDTEGNTAQLNGALQLPLGGDPLVFDFAINTSKLQALNTTSADNDLFFGRAYLNGFVSLSGTPQNIRVDVSGSTIGETLVNIPLSSSSQAQESDFITFISNQEAPPEQDLRSLTKEFSGIDLNFDLEVTPEAETRLIFDSQVGDVIRARGYGNLKLQISSPGDFTMYGDYNIEEGDYLFTLQNVINKKFALERGSQILWSGDPYNATMDIDAVYRLKTSLMGLQIDTSDIYKKRVPVECRITMTEDLMQPEIAFEIDLPTSDPEVRTRVENVLNTQEKINKQFLSLLVLNSFQPVGGYLIADQNNAAQNSAGLGAVTASELLSNQLSNWLSQVSTEWDIGVNYRPGDELSRDQVEVALSTQLFNDRVSINGNVGYGRQYTQSTDLVGDFVVDFKLTQNGKLRLKVFNETNDRLIERDSPYTQGVGLFYREEFNTFGDLWRRFGNKDKQEQEEEEENGASNTQNPDNSNTPSFNTEAVQYRSPRFSHPYP